MTFAPLWRHNIFMVSIIGCDLGTTNVSVARVDAEGWQSDFLSFDANIRPLDLYRTIRDRITPLASETLGGHFFIESVFHGLSHKTYARMTRVAFCLEMVANEFAMPVAYIPTNTWRSMLFGSGKTTKAESQQLAEVRWPGLSGYPTKERGHRSDALCVAYAGYYRTAA